MVFLNASGQRNSTLPLGQRNFPSDYGIFLGNRGKNKAGRRRPQWAQWNLRKMLLFTLNIFFASMCFECWVVGISARWLILFLGDEGISYEF